MSKSINGTRQTSQEVYPTNNYKLEITHQESSSHYNAFKNSKEKASKPSLCNKIINWHKFREKLDESLQLDRSLKTFEN